MLMVMLLGLKPGHACDPTACLSGVHLLLQSHRKLIRTPEGKCCPNWWRRLFHPLANVVHDGACERSKVRCAFLYRSLHSRVPLSFTPSLRCKFGPHTEGMRARYHEASATNHELWHTLLNGLKAREPGAARPFVGCHLRTVGHSVH
jgi:hypothetical protein